MSPSPRARTPFRSQALLYPLPSPTPFFLNRGSKAGRKPLSPTSHPLPLSRPLTSIVSSSSCHSTVPTPHSCPATATAWPSPRLPRATAPPVPLLRHPPPRLLPSGHQRFVVTGLRPCPHALATSTTPRQCTSSLLESRASSRLHLAQTDDRSVDRREALGRRVRRELFDDEDRRWSSSCRLLADDRRRLRLSWRVPRARTVRRDQFSRRKS